MGYFITGFRKKSNLYVLGDCTRGIDLMWLLQSEKIKDATIIQLGNILGINSHYTREIIADWFDDMSDFLDGINSNLILMMGDRDNPEVFKTYHRHNIRCIYDTTRIEDMLFVPRGLTSQYNNTLMTEEELNAHKFQLEPEKLCQEDIQYVFSALNPYIKPSKTGVVPTAVNLIKDNDYCLIRIAVDIISQFNSSFIWYYKGYDMHRKQYMFYYGVEPNNLLKL